MCNAPRYLQSKNLKEHREDKLVEQDNICPLCGEHIEIDKAALDHDHDSGLIRQVLHLGCNTYEGIVLHKFKRSGVHKRTDIVTYLKNLLKYWEQDYSMNFIHPSEKPKEDKMGKREFNKLNKWYLQTYPRRKSLKYPHNKRWSKVLRRLEKEMLNVQEILNVQEMKNKDNCEN